MNQAKKLLNYLMAMQKLHLKKNTEEQKVKDLKY